jgi:translation initiation factor IF-1
MSKEDIIKFEGIVSEILPNNMFRVAIDMPQDQKHIIIAYLSGKMKQNRIKVISGDKVEVEMTPYDLSKGRISFRHR